MNNYKELSKLISKPWMDTKDIMAIACCGIHSATKIRKEIENKIIERGNQLPPSSKKYVPTKMVIEYFSLDEEYIFEMASKNAWEDEKCQ